MIPYEPCFIHAKVEGDTMAVWLMHLINRISRWFCVTKASFPMMTGAPNEFALWLA